jgi:hypothetical protein
MTALLGQLQGMQGGLDKMMTGLTAADVPEHPFPLAVEVVQVEEEEEEEVVEEVLFTKGSNGKLTLYDETVMHEVVAASPALVVWDQSSSKKKKKKRKKTSATGGDQATAEVKAAKSNHLDPSNSNNAVDYQDTEFSTSPLVNKLLKDDVKRAMRKHKNGEPLTNEERQAIIRTSAVLDAHATALEVHSAGTTAKLENDVDDDDDVMDGLGDDDVMDGLGDDDVMDGLGEADVLPPLKEFFADEGQNAHAAAAAANSVDSTASTTSNTTAGMSTLTLDIKKNEAKMAACAEAGRQASDPNTPFTMYPGRSVYVNHNGLIVADEAVAREMISVLAAGTLLDKAEVKGEDAYRVLGNVKEVKGSVIVYVSLAKHEGGYGALPSLAANTP